MKNIQIIDGAINATFSIFQATDEEFGSIFPQPEQDIEIVEDFIDRAGESEADRILTKLWTRPIRKPDVQGIHGTLYYDYKDKTQYLPKSKREIDRK
ncbi:MAG TPA: hypothetical protein VN678_01635 [Acidobacteriaceae bacterium]|nr:hypothetical protein [Acidobacteriaceae bacterium]